MKRIPPKQTVYRGCRFRSRTEARYAVMFDMLGIEWEYEKEGFDLPIGSYLPDFWLPQVKSWAEIKGEFFTEDEFNRCLQLAHYREQEVLLFSGNPSMAPTLSVLGIESLFNMRERELRLSGMIYNLFDENDYHLTAGRFYYCDYVYKTLDRSRIDMNNLRVSQQDIAGLWGQTCHHAWRLGVREDESVIAAKSARFEFGESG